MKPLPVGAERINKGFLQRKISPDRWVFVHRAEWEAANGPVPEGAVLVYLSDPMDFAPTNWRMVPRSALALMQSKFPGGLYAAPVDVRGSIVAAAVLEDKVKRAKVSAGLLPRTRSEALRKGEQHYFSGIPCARGHLSKRSVNRWRCVECDRGRWPRPKTRKRKST